MGSVRGGRQTWGERKKEGKRRRAVWVGVLKEKCLEEEHESVGGSVLDIDFSLSFISFGETDIGTKNWFVDYEFHVFTDDYL